MRRCAKKAVRKRSGDGTQLAALRDVRMVIPLVMTLLGGEVAFAQSSEPERGDVALRIGLEAVSGLAASAMHWVPTIWLEDRNEKSVSRCEEKMRAEGTTGSCGFGLPLAPYALILSFPAATFAVYWVGELAGGDGSLSWTLFGSGIGSLIVLPTLGVLFLSAGEDSFWDSRGRAVALGAAGIIGPALGAVAAYELSQKRGASRARSAILVPSLVPTDDGHGGGISLSGRF